MGLRFFCMLAVLAAPQLAAAQAPRVVVLAPEPLRAPLCEALAIELSARGATVSPSQRPADGDFVVALREGESGYGMVLTANRTGREIHSPRLDATDGRSLAVVAASLLDEVLELPVPGAASTPRPDSPARLARDLDEPLAQGPPPEPAPAPFFDDVPPDEDSTEEPRAEHSVMFGASLGGGFLGGDSTYQTSGAPVARVRLGWRFLNLLRIAASVEGLLTFQEDPFVDGELQPMLMTCLEPSLSLDLDPITGHLGARACLSLREYTRADPGLPGFLITEFGRDVFTAGYALGGFLAASVYTTRDISLWLRADLLAVEPDFGDRTLEEEPQTLSVLGTLTFGFVVE